MRCPICEGEGGWTEVIDYWIGGPYTPCLTCNETGNINLWLRFTIWYWEHLPIRIVEWWGDLRYPYKTEDK